MKVNFRTIENEEKYFAWMKSHADRPCALCECPPLQIFSHWKLITDTFPYDVIANTHDMIVPLRHVDDTNLTNEERLELATIKISLGTAYDMFIENSHHRRSIHEHFHVHAIILKEKI